MLAAAPAVGIGAGPVVVGTGVFVVGTPVVFVVTPGVLVITVPLPFVGYTGVVGTPPGVVVQLVLVTPSGLLLPEVVEVAEKVGEHWAAGRVKVPLPLPEPP